MELHEKNEQRIRERLESGQFTSRDQLVSAALDLLDDLESPEHVNLARIDKARAQLARGEGVPAEKVFADLRARPGLSNY